MRFRFDRGRSRLALAFFVFATTGGTLALAQPAANVAYTHGIQRVEPARYNGDVRNLPQVIGPQRLHLWNEFEEPESRHPAVPPTPEEGNISLAPMPAPTLNFPGLGFGTGVTGGQAGAGWPPDTNGDVGPNHVIEAVNDAWGIFDKSTGTLIAAFTENSLWSSAGTGTPCDNSNFGDPVVVHDGLADRWILSNFAFHTSGGNPVSPFYQCFAVSQTSDPVSGGWYLYAVRMDPGGTGLPPVGTLNDYPKFGVWTDCLYMSSNEFTFPAGVFAGTAFGSFSRTAMYSGAALSASNSSLGFISNASDPFTMIPSNLLGTSADSIPPPGTPNYYVSESQTAFAWEVRAFTAGAGCGTGGTLGAATNVSQTTYTTPSSNIVPQPPPATASNTLDSLGDRMMQKVQYRKIGGTESLWVVHTVRSSASSTTRPQWAQINVSGGTVVTTPVQQQIYAPDTTLYRWMGSVAVDALGDMALGYSTSNASSPNFPSLAYSGRLSGDPLNNLPQTETVLIAGAGSQVNNCGGAACHRWGDYSSMSIDPSDDCTFWYINEYYDTQTNGNSGNWQTRIGSFKFPSCTGVVVTHTVTPSVGTPSGTIAPSTPQTVDDGSTIDFVLTPDAGFAIDNVGGTCGGNLSGNTFTTDAVTADCTVIANFMSSGGGGTFPPDENFDEVTAPALPSGWVTTASGSGTNWTTESTLADTVPNAAFASEFPAVSDMTLDSPVFTASAGMTLSFRHEYNLEHGGGTTAYDGAVLEIAINGGAFTDIVTAGGVFTSGGYNSVISSTFGNPLAGRAAWSGNSAAFVDAIVTLPPSAAGQPCQLRWRTSDDSSDTAGGTPGWWVDTIHLSTAVVLSPPTLAKAFAPASVGVDTPSTATLTLGNTNGGADTLTADLVDTLPSGLVVAATPNASTTCPSGSVTASAGAGSFSLATGAQIPASGSCTVTVDVEAAAANSYVNTLAAGALQTDAGSNAAAASATLTVTGGGGGTFPPDENFDEVTAPALPSGWVTTAGGSGVNWTTDDTVSDTAPNSAFASEFPAVSDMTLDSPVFTASAGMTLSFRHQYNLEHGSGTTAYDGAVLEIAINGGAFTDIVTAGGVFTSGGYNSVISSTFGNPLAGRAAWSGDSAGFVDAVVTLPPAAAGQPCQLRWRTSDDSSDTAGGTPGWWVDTIHLSTAVVLSPPTLAKAFAPASVGVDTPSTATLTLGNTNGGADTLTADLVDTLPSGLVVAATPNASTTCPSGSVTASAGAGSFSLATGAQIPASGSCTVTVDVEAAAANSYVNTLAAGALQTDAGSNASTASATLTVTPAPNPPTLAKAFNPTSVVVNTPSTVTLTLGNTNASADTLTAALTDALPSGLVVANPANASTTCPSGSVTATAGAGSFSLATGALIPAAGSCTVTVNVQSAAANSYVNTLAAGALQTDAGSNASAASATLTVTPTPNPPTLAKTFNPTSVVVNTPSMVTLTLGNTNASTDTLTAALTDALPSGLVVANPANASTTCPSGSVTATAGAGSFSLATGAHIPASGSCTVTVNVQSGTANSYVNTLAAGALQTDAGSNAGAASATLTVTPVIITDRIFCDGFEGVACPPSRIEGAAIGDGTRASLPWQSGEMRVAIDD